jgi:hypothetical protein
MAIRKSLGSEQQEPPELRESDAPGALTLCACLGISVEWVRERLRNGSFESVEAALRATQVASGRCHGQRCLDSFRRLLVDEGVEAAKGWVDWRFPMMDWRFVNWSPRL